MQINKIYNYDILQHTEHPASSRIITITDPPYNVNYKYEAYNDLLPEDEYLKYLSDRIARPCVLIHYAEQTVNLLPRIFGRCEFIATWTYSTRIGKESRLVSWWGCKPDLTKVKIPYASATIKDKRNQHKLKDGRSLSDHWRVPYINNMNKEKIIFGKYNCPQIPEEIIRRIILTTCQEGDLIVDPFSGTGTTSKVAKELGYSSLAFEIGKETYEKSIERIR